jgi:hypothetical protein
MRNASLPLNRVIRENALCLRIPIPNCTNSCSGGLSGTRGRDEGTLSHSDCSSLGAWRMCVGLRYAAHSAAPSFRVPNVSRVMLEREEENACMVKESTCRSRNCAALDGGKLVPPSLRRGLPQAHSGDGGNQIIMTPGSKLSSRVSAS